MEPLCDDPLWDPAVEEAAWDERLTSPRALIDCDPVWLLADGLLDKLVELQAEQSRLALLEAQTMVALAGPFGERHEVTVSDSDGDRELRVVIVDQVREEISAALRRSPTTVHHQITMGRLLAGPLRETGRALAEGRISVGHARVIAAQADRLAGADTILLIDPQDDDAQQAADRQHFTEACGRLEGRVLPWAEHVTPGQLLSRTRRAVDSIDADGQAERRRRARAAVDVDVQPVDDGLALLVATLQIEDAARLKAAIDACANRLADDSASPIGHLRVQALIDAVCGSGHSRTADVTVTTEIQVVVDLATLTGLSDGGGTVSLGSRPPESVTATALRGLLADTDCPATLRLLVTDPTTGHLIDRGRRSYAVSDELRAFLITRNPTCRHPGCTRSARRCQMDHAIAWDDGGGTDRDNLGPLCTRHHQLKTHGGWDLTRSRSDGTAEWLSPMGRRYVTHPMPLVERE